VKELKSRNMEFHTYKLKQEWTFRVVFKHIHATAKFDDIKKEIEVPEHTLLIYETSRIKMLKRPFIGSLPFLGSS